jgi:phosphate:Na+ symporter
MTWYQILISVLATIALFINSLDHFSSNVKKSTNNRVSELIRSVSSSKIKGFFMGMMSTSIIQSSSAVISITISFVDSKIISLAGSLPIMLGSNLGTTVTAWLVTFNIEFLGPILIAAGFVLGYFPERIKHFSKPIFYLGLILFSLQLLSQNLEPVKNSPETIEFLTYAANPISGILLGLLVTAIVQSSSVTVGLVIILSSQQVIGLDSAIGIIVGSNIGTTSTALVASIKMSSAAKRAAFLNLSFNLVGALLYLPIHSLFNDLIKSIPGDIGIQVAVAHLLFNFGVVLLFIPFTNTIAQRFSLKNDV